jgi:hypothetical protein
MAAAVFAANQTDFTTAMGAQVTFTAVILTDLTSPSAATGQHVGSAVGTATGGTLPASSAAEIAFKISRRYRGGKPRIMLPFGTDTNLANPQDWSTTFIANVNNTWQTLVNSMTSNAWPTGGTLQQVNVSYFGPPNKTHTSGSGRVTTVSTPRVPPIVDPVTSFGCATRIGSVRRRLGKGA